MKLIFLFLILSIPFSLVSSGEVKLYTDRNSVFGEKINSRGTFYFNDFKNYFSDFSQESENLVDQNISLKAERFLGFWINDFKKNMLCTNNEYGKYRDYFRYVYRLLYISLLSETLEEIALYLKKYSGVKIDPIKELRSCQPKSDDMKKFLSRVKHFDFFKRSRLVGELLPSQKSEELKNIKGNKSPFINHFVCSGTSCELSEVIESLKNYVFKISKEIRQACEGTESLAKVSNKEILLSLIYDSPALNIFESDRLKSACLNKINEKEFRRLSGLGLSNLLEKVIRFKQNSSYSEIVGNNSLGNLFNFGALKYFDNLGLGDFIFKEIKVAQIKKPIEIKQIIKVIKKKKVNKKISKKIKKIEFQTKKNDEKKYILSAIEKAILSFRVKSESINVDMDKFSLDYPEIKKEFIKIQKPLEIFQTRKSLSIMREVDNLGHKKQPFPLKFLKFLIDFDFHQGLYNILGEIGEEFYVLNDIENKNKPFKILLKNDEATNYKWHIKVIGL